MVAPFLAVAELVKVPSGLDLFAPATTVAAAAAAVVAETLPVVAEVIARVLDPLASSRHLVAAAVAAHR